MEGQVGHVNVLLHIDALLGINIFIMSIKKEALQASF